LRLFGEKRVHWAIMFVAFIVGIPVFFQVGFVLLIPLVFTIARRSGLSLVKIGIPLVAGLSVVHGNGAAASGGDARVVAYKADIGRTIAYAILVGLPTAALAGPIFASWIAPRIQLPAENPVAAQFTGGRGGTGGMVPHDTPGFGISLFTVLLPVILMLCASAADVALDSGTTLRSALDFVGGPIVAFALGAAVFLLVAGVQATLHARSDPQVRKRLPRADRHDSPGDRRRRRVQPGARGERRRASDCGCGIGIARLATPARVDCAALIRVANGLGDGGDDDERWNRRPDCCGYVGNAPRAARARDGAGSLYSHT